MALYSSLPVFKASYDLLLSIYEASKHFSRDYRYTIGEDLKNRTMEVLLCIYKANAATNSEKEVYLRRARECAIEIRLYIRLLYDLKQVSSKKAGQLILNIESVTKQLIAWAKSVRAQERKNEPGVSPAGTK